MQGSRATRKAVTLCKHLKARPENSLLLSERSLWFRSRDKQTCLMIAPPAAACRLLPEEPCAVLQGAAQKRLQAEPAPPGAQHSIACNKGEVTQGLECFWKPCFLLLLSSLA